VTTLTLFLESSTLKKQPWVLKLTNDDHGCVKEELRSSALLPIDVGSLT
jgi:hypothetical protein